jgi:hypothetical protein
MTIDHLVDLLEVRIRANLKEIVRAEFDAQLTGPLAMVVRLAEQLDSVVSDLAAAAARLGASGASASSDSNGVATLLDAQREQIVAEILNPSLDALMQLAEHLEAVQAASAWAVVRRLQE